MSEMTVQVRYSDWAIVLSTTQDVVEVIDAEEFLFRPARSVVYVPRLDLEFEPLLREVAPYLQMPRNDIAGIVIEPGWGRRHCDKGYVHCTPWVFYRTYGLMKDAIAVCGQGVSY